VPTILKNTGCENREGVIVAAEAVVTKELPDYFTAGSVPVRAIKRII